MSFKKPQIILTKKLRHDLQSIIIHDYKGPKSNLKYPYRDTNYKNKLVEYQNYYNSNLLVPVEEFDLCDEIIKDLPKSELLKAKSIYLKNNKCSVFSISMIFLGLIFLFILLSVRISSGVAGPIWSSILMFTIAMISLFLDKFSLPEATNKFIKLISNFETTTKKNLKEFKETGKISGHLFISKNTQNIIWFSNHDVEEINKNL